MKAGSLTIVGTGIRLVGQVSLEARAAIEKAQKVIFLVADPATQQWIRDLNPTSESLQDCYAPGKPRINSYHEMVDRIVSPVRRGLKVCAVFYGHPGIFVYPSHVAIRRARAEGHEAVMLPAISAEDCLFADLGIDPGARGCQSYEATEFLVHSRKPDISSYLILWQIGVVGDVKFSPKGNLPERLRVLADTLKRYYGEDQKAIIYEAAQYPVCKPRIVKTTIGKMLDHHLTGISTLFISPKTKPTTDAEMLTKLKMDTVTA